MSDTRNLFGKNRPAPKPAKAKVKKPAAPARKVSPRYRKPPRPEPAEIFDYHLDDEGWLHVVVPPGARPCDVLATWGAAWRELL